MGNHDRRNSMKMRRRKSQTKLKARLKRRMTAGKPAAAAPKKSAAKKTAAAKA